MRVLKPCFLLMLKVTALCFAASSLAIQSAAQQSTSSASDVRPSHIDLYGGYAYIRPFDSYIARVPYHAVGNINTTISVTDYFTRHFGLQVEGSYFSGGSKRGVIYQCSPSCASRDQLFYAAEAGPIFRLQMGRFTPYIHVLAGGARVNGPYAQPLTWGSGVTGGGGLDYTLPFAGNHLALRLFQVDMYYSHVDYGHLADLTRGGVGDVLAAKGSAGLVLKLGSLGSPTPVTLACAVQPDAIYPGDAVAVTCTPGNLNAKRKADYSFTASGGQLTVTGSSASISTAGLAPGNYTVNSRLTQGAKPYEQASSNGSFTVRAFEPPSVAACTVEPAKVVSGETAALMATAASPQSRPLTYTFSSSAGQISVSGSSATFSTAGLRPGTVTLTCNVSDDQGRSSSASTSVLIVSRSVEPSPQPRGLCTISFTRDPKRPVRVNNEAKACLDDIALTLNREVTDKLLIVGHQNSDEQPQAAAERARNESLYLEREKGVDPSRLELRTSNIAGQAVDNLLLLAGAPAPSTGTTVVDPSTIPQNGEAYGRPNAHRRQAKHKGSHHRSKRKRRGDS